MIFEEDIYIDIVKARNYYEKESVHLKTSIIIKKFIATLTNDQKSRNEILAEINDVAHAYEYKRFVSVEPFFDKGDPLRIERAIISLKIFCNILDKAYCLGLMRLVKNMEDIARKTYDLRMRYYNWE